MAGSMHVAMYTARRPTALGLRICMFRLDFDLPTIGYSETPPEVTVLSEVTVVTDILALGAMSLSVKFY